MDWVHKYKAEIDKLQFPPQEIMSLLHSDNRRNEAIELALKNGIKETAEQLDIPYSILSLLVFDHENM